MEIKAEKLEKLNATAEQPPDVWDWIAAGAAAVAAIAKLIGMMS